MLVRKLPESKQTPAPVETETKLIAVERLSSRTTPADVFQVKFHEVSTQYSETAFKSRSW